jgi:hypothetical protein
MSYRRVLILVGVALVALGAVERDWFLIAVWLGCNLVIVGLAHGRGAHRVFGKRGDGTLPLWSWLLFFPLLALTTGVWHLIRLLSREPARSKVSDQLVVGRRLLASELDGEFDNYVDLTAEFSEPRVIRRSPGYRSFAILDGAAPAPEALRAAVAGLRPGRTFVHCAQGHGRAALFALAVLLSSGVVRGVDDGLRLLSAARPGIRLSGEQRKCIRAYAQGMGRA